MYFSVREGHWPAIYLLFFLFPFFFFFLIVELIQPILSYNKKIITEKREKHAFFFWCLVKVGKNMSIWHGNYSSSPFISHASWGNDGSCRKKCPARFLDLDQWLKATLKWDLMKVSVDQYTAYCIQTCSNYIQRPVQNQQLYRDTVWCMHKHKILSIFQILSDIWDCIYNIVKTICLKGFRNICNADSAFW